MNSRNRLCTRFGCNNPNRKFCTLHCIRFVDATRRASKATKVLMNCHCAWYNARCWRIDDNHFMNFITIQQFQCGENKVERAFWMIYMRITFHRMTAIIVCNITGVFSVMHLQMNVSISIPNFCRFLFYQIHSRSGAELILFERGFN